MTSDPTVPFVPKKVHVAAVGFEVDRVAEPIVQMRGDLAILVANIETGDLASRFRQGVEKRLRDAGIPTEVERAPIFDLNETCETFLRVFRAHSEDRVYFNASSGSKVQVLSGYIATMIASAEGLDVEAYYAEPLRYAPTKGEPLSRGFRRAFSLPRLTLRVPDSQLRAALEELENGPLSKFRLASRLARRGVLENARLDSSGRPGDSAARASLHGKVETRVVRPLVEWGFVTTPRVGRDVRVTLTDEGRQAIRFFCKVTNDKEVDESRRKG